jgi:Ca2+-binding RTX toxin-like protein
VTSAAASGAASDTIHAGSGLLTINAGAVGVNVVAGSGNVTLNGGTGADVFAGGAGRAVLNLGGGADTITFGNGATTVNGGANDTFVVPVGDTGTAVITNWSAGDHFAASGGSEAALASATVSGGNYVMSFAGGAQIELVGVTHLT